MAVKRAKPVILDYLIGLHISSLNKAFALKRVAKTTKHLNLYCSNPITAKKQIVASVLITVNIDSSTNDYAIIEYCINGVLKRQTIDLIAKRIKLTTGYEFFFKCPLTGKRSRKLFLHKNIFVSKQAIPNACYLSQMQPVKYRDTIRDLKRIIKHQNAVKEGSTKYFMKMYKGTPTKRYLRVIEAAGKLNRSW